MLAEQISRVASQYVIVKPICSILGIDIFHCFSGLLVDMASLFAAC